MEDRTLSYEEKFKNYLFKGDVERFKSICNYIGITANINVFMEEVEE